MTRTRRIAACILSVAFLLPALRPAAVAPARAQDEEVNPPAQQLDLEVERLIKELNALEAKIGPDKARILRERRDLYALGLLQLEKARIGLSQPLGFFYGQDLARQSLEEAVTIWRTLAEDGPADLPTHGKLERAYLAPNDTSPQPYILYVPEDYDGTEAYGLLLFLHGYTPSLNKATWGEMMYSPAMETVATESRCILMLPYARGNTDFQGAGEDDVMLAIGKVKADYKIDEDRVFLSGISMGGMGVWSIGGHYPHVFAGLIVLAGRGDYYMWKGIERDSLTPWKRKLVRGEFGAEYTGNYLHVPCVIVHGLDDWVMPINQSDRMFELLSKAGLDVHYDRLEGVGHYSWPEMLTAPGVTACLAEQRRTRAPRRVTFSTYNLKYNRAYWAEILAIDDWGKPAELDCELDRAGASVTIKTKNVLALRIRPPRELLNVQVLSVNWNGIESKHPPNAKDDGWIRLGAPPPDEGELNKTPDLCGPIREVFAGPFLMVYSGEEDGQSYKRMLQGARDWLVFSQGTPAIIHADKVTQELMDAYNLVLFGTPEDNPLIARIAPQLPVKLGNGRYGIGDRSYDAGRYGLSMIYPNPLAPGRYVVVNSGLNWGKDLAPNHVYDMLPDFIVFTQATTEEPTESNQHVCAGFFDQRWQLDDRTTWHAPEPAAEEGADEPEPEPLGPD